MMNSFEKMNEWVRNTESSFVNLISAIAPWLAPLAPAYMTYQHADGTLNFPPYISIPGAVTVEILGFSAISTFLAFYFHNKKNRADAKKAPVGLVVTAFLFYLTLILVSNVLLDTFENAKWALITVRGLFTLQSIPAAMIVAVRTQHRDMLKMAEAEKARKVTGNLPETGDEKEGNFPKDWRTFRQSITDEQVRGVAVSTSKDIAFYYRVSERTARNWRKYAQDEVNSASK